MPYLLKYSCWGRGVLSLLLDPGSGGNALSTEVTEASCLSFLRSQLETQIFAARVAYPQPGTNEYDF